MVPAWFLMEFFCNSSGLHPPHSKEKEKKLQKAFNAFFNFHFGLCKHDVFFQKMVSGRNGRHGARAAFPVAEGYSGEREVVMGRDTAG